MQIYNLLLIGLLLAQLYISSFIVHSGRLQNNFHIIITKTFKSSIIRCRISSLKKGLNKSLRVVYFHSWCLELNGHLWSFFINQNPFNDFTKVQDFGVLLCSLMFLLMKQIQTKPNTHSLTQISRFFKRPNKDVCCKVETILWRNGDLTEQDILDFSFLILTFSWFCLELHGSFLSVESVMNGKTIPMNNQ